jgi:hypothetical protein
MLVSKMVEKDPYIEKRTKPEVEESATGQEVYG